MGQREGGGNEDFGLRPRPHQQEYSPQLIKAGIVLVVLRDALPAPLNLREGCWLSVLGTALCLNSCLGWSGGLGSTSSNRRRGLEIRLNIIFSRVVSCRWYPSTRVFSWQFPTPQFWWAHLRQRLEEKHPRPEAGRGL